MSNEKFLALAATVILGGALLIAGCGNDNNKQAANDGKQVLKIGATAVPHAEILEQVKPVLAKDGIDLKSLNSLITTHQLGFGGQRDRCKLLPTCTLHGGIRKSSQPSTSICWWCSS